jgi:hypothetical protein
MKLAEEYTQRNISMNDLVLLGILRAMRNMTHIKKEQYAKIEERINHRYTPGAKLYRIIKLVI